MIPVDARGLTNFVQCDTCWFHLACVGLGAVPEGEWLCKTCLERRGDGNEEKGVDGEYNDEIMEDVQNQNEERVESDRAIPTIVSEK